MNLLAENQTSSVEVKCAKPTGPFAPSRFFAAALSLEEEIIHDSYYFVVAPERYCFDLGSFNDMEFLGLGSQHKNLNSIFAGGL